MSREKIDLEYDNLEIEYVKRHGNPTGYYDSSLGGWLPDEDETATTTIHYTYEVDKDDIVSLIVENYLTEADYPGLEDVEDTSVIETFVERYFDQLFTKYEEEILSYFYDDAVEDAESDYDPHDYIDWDSMPGGHDDYRFDESLDISDYDYAGYERGYDIYRKVVDGKGVWAAKYVGDDKDHQPFEITYDQALGKEPIKDPYGINKLARRLGKVLLSDTEPLDETWVNIDTIDYSLVKDLNDFLKSRQCDHRADIARRNGTDCIYFDVIWGDWKHDHIRLWYLVNEFFRDRGYIIEREVVTTEENGTDSYSAEHYFEIMKDDEEFTVDDEMDSPMYLRLLDNNINEGYIDDIREQEAKGIKDAASKATNAMGSLVSKLGIHNKNEWEAQISQEDINNMKDAANAAWLLYHYKNDGKVRPIHR